MNKILINKKINQINQIKKINKINQINQINTKKPMANRISKKDYSIIAKTIDALPFPISTDHRNLVAWQYNRVGRIRFLQMASDSMKCAYNPEAYFMKCLKNEPGKKMIDKRLTTA